MLDCNSRRAISFRNFAITRVKQVRGESYWARENSYTLVPRGCSHVGAHARERGVNERQQLSEGKGKGMVPETPPI
jgi:hypothetical protein